MRITLTIDDALLVDANALAARSGLTLDAVIEDALRVAVTQQRRASDRPRAELPTYWGGRLQPGVNLDSNSDLLDFLDANPN